MKWIGVLAIVFLLGCAGFSDSGGSTNSESSIGVQEIKKHRANLQASKEIPRCSKITVWDSNSRPVP